MQRLKDFPPNLQDVIVVASTASVDVGLVTRSKVPLTNDAPAEKVSNVFTTTGMADDSRRAQLPMTEELADTSPIGVAFDLSSKEKVPRPLPKEEFDASQGPLPALMILNNDGVLSSWWLVYADSIRQGTTFPGLTVAGGSQVQQPQAERQVSPFANANAQAAPAFGQSAFGRPSIPTGTFGGAFSKPATPAFGSASAPGSAFGASSGLGKSQSPWGAATTAPVTSQGAAPTFGQPAFGSSTPLGVGTSQAAAFGMAGGLGNRTSPWGAPSSGTAAATGSVFGQSGFSGAKKSPLAAGSTGSAFGSNAAPSDISVPTSGGFASFAAKPSGFMTATPSTGAANPFAKTTPGASFGSGMDTDISFGGTPKKDTEAPKSLFGEGDFKLGSTFKGDGSAAKNGPKSSGNAPASLFGDGFGDALGQTEKDVVSPQTKDADMDEGEDDAQAESGQGTPTEKESITSVAKLDPPKLQFPKTAPPSAGGLFGTQAQSKTTPASVQNSQPAGFTFGEPTTITTTPDDTPQKPDQLPRSSIETSPKIKEEPQSDEDDISPLNEDEAAPPEGYDTPETPIKAESKESESPLPPESTSKASFAPGDSSSSSKSSDDAPLPPDFLPSKTKLKEVEAAPEEQAALPAEDEDEDEDEDDGLDDEGSGVDVAQEISPTTDPNQSPKITPGSSFGAPVDKSPLGGLFSKVPQKQDGQKSRPLFGEVAGTSAPYLPPPSKVQQSPRSPSPVRSTRPGDSLRPDNARSISAPGPFKSLSNRANAPTRMAVPSKPQQSAEDRRKQEQERLAAQQAKQAAEEEQDLSDREDEKVREELHTEVKATKTLDPFLAHQDYIGNIDKPGIPGQIEKVYRDINSMIDTLGLNARSLEAFVKGHNKKYKEDGRAREDLEKGDWSLFEIADLMTVESKLAEQLENGRIQGVQGKIQQCRELRKGGTLLRAKSTDIAKAIDTKSDPEEIEFVRTAPLSLDQATQQHEIRKKYTQFQKSLAEAEEGISMLRVKLASCASSNGTTTPLKKPTVEAVTNTIMKMTSMVEKRSGDIDVLETQMRKLRFSSADGQSSREGSPFTPVSSTSPRRKLGRSMQNGHVPDLLRSALGKSQNGVTPRKGIGEVTPEEVQRYRVKAQRRREVNAIMKEAFSKTGPRIRGLD